MAYYSEEGWLATAPIPHPCGESGCMDVHGHGYFKKGLNFSESNECTYRCWPLLYRMSLGLAKFLTMEALRWCTV